MHKRNHSSIIRWITSFIVLTVLFFILPASCDDPNTNGGSTDIDGDGVMNSADVDDDNDGLIEIHNLDMFDNIRLNLAGTSYNGVTIGGSTSATANCPDDSDDDGVFLCGYELMVNLDFAQGSSYASGTVNGTWCPTSSGCIGDTSQAGFPGIGAASGDTGGFNAIFEGNGKTITNFYSRDTAASVYIGLFRSTSSTAQIRSLGVTNGNVYGGIGGNNIGILVGRNRGTMIASSASGSADGGAGDADNVGLLAGINRNNGTITASHAAGSTDGGDGAFDAVGGLVGNNAGTITASYATGNADGGDSGLGNVGGLVGENAGTIRASYATGSVYGGDDDADNVGGLVGENTAGATIIASYATGNADGGDGNNDRAGSLVGNDTGTFSESYGFGMTTNFDIAGRPGSVVPTLTDGTDITSVTELGASQTATTGDASPTNSPWWNAASSTGAGAWDFGTDMQNPALVYSDYDGTAGNKYPSCSNAEGLFLTIPGTTTQIDCGSTLVGGYRPPTP